MASGPNGKGRRVKSAKGSTKPTAAKLRLAKMKATKQANANAKKI